MWGHCSLFIFMSIRLQPGESPSRDLLRDCEIIRNLQITFVCSSTEHRRGSEEIRQMNGQPSAKHLSVVIFILCKNMLNFPTTYWHISIVWSRWHISWRGNSIKALTVNQNSPRANLVKRFWTQHRRTEKISNTKIFVENIKANTFKQF